MNSFEGGTCPKGGSAAAASQQAAVACGTGCFYQKTRVFLSARRSSWTEKGLLLAPARPPATQVRGKKHRTRSQAQLFIVFILSSKSVLSSVDLAQSVRRERQLPLVNLVDAPRLVVYSVQRSRGRLVALLWIDSHKIKRTEGHPDDIITLTSEASCSSNATQAYPVRHNSNNHGEGRRVDEYRSKPTPTRSGSRSR